MIMIFFLIKLSVYEKWVSTVVPRQRDDIIISDLDLKKKPQEVVSMSSISFHTIRLITNNIFIVVYLTKQQPIFSNQNIWLLCKGIKKQNKITPARGNGKNIWCILSWEKSISVCTPEEITRDAATIRNLERWFRPSGYRDTATFLRTT